MIAGTGLDLRSRPDTYFRPTALGEHLKNAVHGAKRRQVVAQYVDEGRLDELPGEFLQKQLTEEERVAAVRLHPELMGGEYLPEDAEMEVEIARVTLRSTLNDVTAIRARPEDGRVRLRVVDEYGGETLSGDTERVAEHPLTLEELLGFYLGAEDLYAVLDMSYEGDLEGALGFFEGSSAFYPQFDAALRAYVTERYRESYGDDAEEGNTVEGE